MSVRKVTLGPSDGIKTAILSGLEVGDTVVVDGTDRLSDGAKISIAPATAANPAAPSTHRTAAAGDAKEEIRRPRARGKHAPGQRLSERRPPMRAT